MKIIDGKNAILGRLSSYAAKQALKGEEVIILNCEETLITGNKETIKKEFLEKRSRVGSSQKGPIHPKPSFQIVKRAIRGMLPDHRSGKGKIAFKKIKCYDGVPKEYEKSKKIVGGKNKPKKFSKIKILKK